MDRATMYNSMVIYQQAYNDAKILTSKMKTNEAIYQDIADSIKPVPWWAIAVIHEMECQQNFNLYLGNGQPWNRVTTIVPKGRGPFTSFKSGALDALNEEFADHVDYTDLNHVLYFFEAFNGFGYEKYHNIASPYLWSGTNFYVKGKYDRDGHFDPNEVSKQTGIAVLLKQLI